MEKIVIFGCSGRGKEILFLLNPDKYEVVGFVDNNKALEGRSVYGGYSVKLPENINDWQFDRIIISIPEYYDSIKKQLNSIGVDESIITVFNPINPIERNDNRIAYLQSCVERIHELNVPGACAEVGVYRGDFAKYINKFMPEKKLYLFDTFEGFMKQELTKTESKIANMSAFTDTSIDVVLEKMTSPENCIIKKGLFPLSATDICEEKYAFVSLDADLYQPIYDGLVYFYPKLSKGGYIFVHDYGMNLWPGAKEAVDRFCEEYNVSIIPMIDMCLSAIIVK